MMRPTALLMCFLSTLNVVLAERELAPRSKLGSLGSTMTPLTIGGCVVGGVVVIAVAAYEWFWSNPCVGWNNDKKCLKATPFLGFRIGLGECTWKKREEAVAAHTNPALQDCPPGRRLALRQMRALSSTWGLEKMGNLGKIGAAMAALALSAVVIKWEPISEWYYANPCVGKNDEGKECLNATGPTVVLADTVGLWQCTLEKRTEAITAYKANPLSDC